MRKILLTGADGFIGGYLRKALDREKIEYMCVCQFPTNKVPENRQFVSDMTDRESLEKIFRDFRPDVILHMAAIAFVDFKNIAELYRVNILGTENMIEMARKYCKPRTKFIFVSTAGVYGNQAVDFYTEDLPYKPSNHYSYSKMIGEMMLKNAKDHLDIVILRPFTVIGKGQTQGFFISKLVKAFQQKEPIIKLGNIGTERDYVDVEYCAEVMVELIKREDISDEIFNICTGIVTKGYDVIAMLEEMTGFHPEIQISEEFIRANEVWRLVGSAEKVEDLMKNVCKCNNLKDVLAEMLEEKKTC